MQCLSLSTGTSPKRKIFPKWRTSFVCMCACNCWDLQSFQRILCRHLFRGRSYITWVVSSGRYHILKRSVNLMNLDLDREVTAINRSSRRWPGVCGRRLAVRCFSSEETDSKSWLCTSFHHSWINYSTSVNIQSVHCNSILWTNKNNDFVKLNKLNKCILFIR